MNRFDRVLLTYILFIAIACFAATSYVGYVAGEARGFNAGLNRAEASHD